MLSVHVRAVECEKIEEDSETVNEEGQELE